MFKTIFIFLLGLFIFQEVAAQGNKISQDTILYYLKSSGQLANKDSADYTMLIMPRNPVTGLFPLIQFYPNGKRKFIGATHTQLYTLTLDGPGMSFYPDGHRKTVGNYKANYLIETVYDYYPNGKLYAVKKYDVEHKITLMECRDSTGKVLAENGNGHWLKFDADYKNLYEDGQVANGTEDGAWSIYLDNKKYDFIYTKGTVTKPMDHELTEDIYKTADVAPNYKGGVDMFWKLLVNTVHYPVVDREANVQGKVLVSFIIEKDGSLSNYKIETAPSKTLGVEALRTIRLSSPWIPASIAGKPVRMAHSVPVSFTLGSGR